MRRIAIGMLLGVAALAWIAAAAQPAGAPIKALVVTGNDVKSHDWKNISPELGKILEARGRFEVTIAEINKNPNILDSADQLKSFDVIVQNYVSLDLPPLTDVAKENLLSFVRNGKGFVCFHLSSAAWQDWEEWHTMVGRWWKMKESGHGPLGKFTSKIVAPDDPICRRIKDFETEDELYAKLLGDEKINVLVAADSDWSKRTEPLVFTRDYGKGRVFHFCYGHTVQALQTPEVRRLFARGVEWAATGKVTPGPRSGKGSKAAAEAKNK